MDLAMYEGWGSGALAGTDDVGGSRSDKTDTSRREEGRDNGQGKMAIIRFEDMAVVTRIGPSTFEVEQKPGGKVRGLYSAWGATANVSLAMIQS
jgi:hypothetical protein